MNDSVTGASPKSTAEQPDEATIETLAMSRIAAWLLQNYAKDYGDDYMPLDTCQMQAREIWGLIRHYQQPEQEAIGREEVEIAIKEYIGSCKVAQKNIAEVAAYALLQHFDIRKRGTDNG